jgi:hypothetical protein
MTRDMTAEAVTASQTDKGFTVIAAAELDFSNGFVRVHSGAGPKVLLGNTYKGIGGFGRITAIEEKAELGATLVELSISGLDPTENNVNTVLTTNYRNRPATVYLAFIDSNGDVVSDPTILFRGFMDNAVIAQGKELSVTVRINSIMADWDRAKVARYTNEEQQDRFPGDRGLEFVPQMVEKEIKWG